MTDVINPTEANEDLQTSAQLEIFAKSDAGRALINELRSEAADIIDGFIALLNKPDLNKYISLSCQLKEKLETAKKFTGAGDLRQVIEDSLKVEESEV
jgi:hypothetical protein